jgi:DNA-binding transcriptional LysR family regulator
MKNLQGLLSFLESSSAGSFTLAAARLALTPAAVSKNVQKLEAELGVRLFNRSTRRIRLTAEGEAFALQAREALRALDEAVAHVAHVAQGQAEPSGRVRISVGSSFGRRHVLPALPGLLQKHPLLQVDVSLDNRTADLVGEGFDIGIRGGVVRDSSLVARRVAQLPLVLVASPECLARRGVPRSQADLLAHELLATRFPSGAVSNWRFRPSEPGGQALDWTPPARLHASDPEALVDLAVAGAGVLQVALHHAVPALRAGQLKLLLGGIHDTDDRAIVLHYPHRQFLSPRVRVVVDTLLAHFAAAADLHLRPAEVPAAWWA